MRLTPGYYAQAWFSSLQEVPSKQWPEVSGRVLRHIYQHGHIKWLPDIERAMAGLEHQHNATTPVTVRSAHPLDVDFVTTIIKQYLPTTTPVIQQAIDTTLIGGVQIETVNVRYNTSIKSQLNQLAYYVRN